MNKGSIAIKCWNLCINLLPSSFIRFKNLFSVIIDTDPKRDGIIAPVEGIEMANISTNFESDIKISPQNCQDAHRTIAKWFIKITPETLVNSTFLPKKQNHRVAKTLQSCLLLFFFTVSHQERGTKRLQYAEIETKRCNLSDKTEIRLKRVRMKSRSAESEWESIRDRMML